MSTADWVSPPSTRSRVSGCAEVAGDEFGELRDLSGDALEQRPHQMTASAAQRHPGRTRRRAAESHHGAASPASAGTHSTPPLESAATESI